jgi:hypothetical protein
MEIPKQKTPITDRSIVAWKIPKSIEYVEAEVARRLEVMCQELATALELEMNEGYSCQELRDWNAMHDSPTAVYSSNEKLTDAAVSDAGKQK